VIERYLQIRAATVAGHLPSGELGYLTDVTGLLQLWRVAPDGFHEQVTFGSERVTAAIASPSEERWVIARDAGGNERHAMFSIDATGAAELPLSDNPDAIHVPGAFSPDGSEVAYTHTGRNGIDFDVAVVPVTGGEPRELAQPGGWSHVVDWSEHGILVQRANAPFDHDLYLVDTDSGATVHLTPHDGEVAYDSARFLPDGAVLCASDPGSEFARLCVLRQGAELPLLTADDADVELIALDAPRTRPAWTINRGGESELWLDGVPVEGLPGGVITALAFAPDGSLTVTTGPPDDSTDVWAASPAVARRTRSAVGGLDRSGFVRPVLEEVESFDGRRIPYLRFGEAGRPALCWVHGGPESQFRPQMAAVIQYLCAQGITVAAPNVRGSTGYGRTYHHLDDVRKRLDSVADLAALAQALGAGAGTPVGVMGGSYGGYMTMAAITEHPALWQCAVNIVGIVNFVTFLERTGAYRRALREAEYGSLERDREFLESISPIRKIDLIACPLMVIHGANDPRVPVGEAEQVVEALRARSAPVEYLRYEDEGHGITRLSNRLDCYPRVAAFLQRHLLGAP
jgi:dipeptidyl aminopeptidase/acylaminoacyl peptidase